MNYKQTIQFLFSSLPMFQRIGDSAIKKNLDNIKQLCVLLGQPQTCFQTIHVAGTNGKGSVSHMLASVFQAAGKKVGLYTSPHYVDFRERIRINGDMIGEQDVVHFVENYHQQWEVIEPSFFEITVAMAFDYFRNKKVDIAIIETGLGGRLDSTNVILPKLSVITNIGFDHMQMLGNTLPEIAFEKAGIIKHQVPVIIGEWQSLTAPVFKQKARTENAPIHFASRHIQLHLVSRSQEIHHYEANTRVQSWLPSMAADLTGPYQTKNIRTSLEAIWCWNAYYPDEKINDQAIVKGMATVKKSTGMIGRWLTLQQNPLVIADAAHNLDGMKAMLPGLLKLPARQRHFVLGFVADKDIVKLLSLFPLKGRYYWCAPDLPRAKAPKETKEAGAQLGLHGMAFNRVWEAFQSALLNSEKSDLIFIGGSSYVVGDFLTKNQPHIK